MVVVASCVQNLEAKHKAQKPRSKTQSKIRKKCVQHLGLQVYLSIKFLVFQVMLVASKKPSRVEKQNQEATCCSKQSQVFKKQSSLSGENRMPKLLSREKQSTKSTKHIKVECQKHQSQRSRMLRMQNTEKQSAKSVKHRKIKCQEHKKPRT